MSGAKDNQRLQVLVNKVHQAEKLVETSFKHLLAYQMPVDVKKLIKIVQKGVDKMKLAHISYQQACAESHQAQMQAAQEARHEAIEEIQAECNTAQAELKALRAELQTKIQATQETSHKAAQAELQALQTELLALQAELQALHAELQALRVGECLAQISRANSCEIIDVQTERELTKPQNAGQPNQEDNNTKKEETQRFHVATPIDLAKLVEEPPR